MNFKLSYYEDEHIKIEIKDESVSYTYKSSGFNKDNIDHSMNVVRYLFGVLDNLNKREDKVNKE